MRPRRIRKGQLLFFAVTAGLLVFLSISGVLRPLGDRITRRLGMPLVSMVRGLAQKIGAGDRAVAEIEDPSLLSRLAELEILRKENAALTRALGLGFETGKKIVPSWQVGFSRMLGEEFIVINRGSETGINIGDPVFTEDKIYVGHVFSVGEGRADILRITSPSQSTDVFLVSRGIRGQARGAGGGEFSIEFIPEGVSVQKNDLFVVAPRAGEPASGLVVGEIREVTAIPSEVFQNIRAIHLFDPYRYQPLFVALSRAT